MAANVFNCCGHMCMSSWEEHPTDGLFCLQAPLKSFWGRPLEPGVKKFRAFSVRSLICLRRMFLPGLAGLVGGLHWGIGQIAPAQAFSVNRFWLHALFDHIFNKLWKDTDIFFHSGRTMRQRRPSMLFSNIIDEARSPAAEI